MFFFLAPQAKILENPNFQMEKKKPFSFTEKSRSFFFLKCPGKKEYIERRRLVKFRVKNVSIFFSEGGPKMFWFLKNMPKFSKFLGRNFQSLKKCFIFEYFFFETIFFGISVEKYVDLWYFQPQILFSFFARLFCFLGAS